MKRCLALLSLVLSGYLSFAQTTITWGLEDTRTEFKDDASEKGSMSGFFQSHTPVNYPVNNTVTPFGDWWHLLDVRHTNKNYNLAMQFASKFADQKLYFRNIGDVASQSWSKILMSTNGRVGVHTDNPRALFDVGLSTTEQNPNILTTVLGRLYEGDNVGDGTFVGVRAVSSQNLLGPSFSLEHRFYNNLNSAINFCRGYGDFDGFLTFSTSNNTERLRIDAFGNVLIGTTKPRSLLTVAGTITAQKIKVTATEWADFVFEDSYTLPSLYELENYIRANKHLPEIPTAKQVEQDGVDLADMNKKLLQKVEELTLYVIELKKQVDALEATKENKK
ncbi:hypothetical protein SAMN05444266_10574 [Chitinophaga jiangningensis]|uniref:Uncharacterized protein n=1 Tax=Chitinophaga jiangningensis TaxID=1419482 RepID=A0A1M7DP15_9BACT|nr:hypothetical protein [Chitinophaga jiangningensis]SHL81254.1 hypothetical protein SAMN05444266_10574 [Chitinophaga jiangningensis]